MQNKENVSGDIMKELDEVEKLGEGDMAEAEAYTSGGTLFTYMCC
ncbi:MAG: hypothetical protein Q4C91_09155 [Eubacteriales bacterium]|nr:hypothetical protein [Eubacteriales bacterium]